MGGAANGMAAEDPPDYNLPEIKTRSIEQTLLPLIKQVTTVHIESCMLLSPLKPSPSHVTCVFTSKLSESEVLSVFQNHIPITKPN